MRLNNLLTMMNITILVHILKVPQLGDIDTLLCFTDMHSVWVKIQIYSIMQVLLPDVTRLLVVTSRVLFQTLSLTLHFVLQLMEANQKQGVKSSLIRWRNLALFIVLCPVTRLKMDVHWAASSLEWVQSTSSDVEVHLSHAGYTAVRKKCQDFGERGSCVMFWPVNKGLHFRR